MQNIVVVSPYARFLECTEFPLLCSAYSGASNLYADYMNSFASGDINQDLAEFLQEQAANPDTMEIESILDDPDMAILTASRVFFDGIAELFIEKGNGELLARERAEQFRLHANAKFDIFGKYFLFSDPWSNACSNLFIIQAQAEHEAFDILIEEFEKFFLVDEADLSDEEKENHTMNDRGNYVNIDNVSLVGSLEFKREK